jgi:hypothetical protein
MSNRTVEAVFTAPAPHMVGDGFRVHHFFPDGVIQDKQRMSPFFMLRHSLLLQPTPHEVWVYIHIGVLKRSPLPTKVR